MVYYPANYQEIKILSGNRALLTENVIHTEEVKLDTKWGYKHIAPHNYIKR